MKQGFPNSIKIWKFYLEEFWPFNAFAILKIRFSNHRLIKISMIYLHIKPEVKKKWYGSNDCSYKWRFYWMITWKLLFCEVDFLVREISISFADGRNSAQYAGFLPKVGGSARQSIHGGGNKWDERKGKFFCKMGYTGGIIQRDNSAGHCFLLRDLIPLKVFK